MAVRPRFHGLGIGRNLLKTAVKFTSEHGYKRVTLETCAEHAVALRFYDKMGFKTCHTAWYWFHGFPFRSYELVYTH